MLLASMILGNRWLWIIMALSILVHITIGSLREPVGLPEILAHSVPGVGLLTGIALLQWFTTNQLQQALDHLRKVAASLQSEMADRKRAEAALARNAEEMALLYETSIEINAQMDLPTLLQAILRQAARLLSTGMAGIYFVEPAGADPGSAVHLPASPPEHLLALEKKLADRVMGCGDALAVENSEGRPGSVLPGMRALGVPLRAGGRVIGALLAADTQPGTFDKEVTCLASLFADQAAIAIENARLYAEVQRLAIVDDLTGLFNRRGLVEFGQREFERARRFNRPLAAIFLDLDHFKNINDLYGHPVGDQVLRVLANRMRANTREVDLAGRYGGEEFVILLPEIGPEAALLTAERVRLCMAETPVQTNAGEVRVSLSLGVALLNDDIPDLDSLIDTADQAVLVAKRNGRNRVETGFLQVRQNFERSVYE
jgi:diguanylate cyclase (GGDEF)-like protein